MNKQNIREQYQSTYKTWRTMCRRCRDPRKKNYYEKVFVSPEWTGRHGFENFLRDMGPRPSEAHTIDRLSQHYFPKLCRWATMTEQNRNRRNNHLLAVGNRTMTLVEWAETTGIKQSTLGMRLGTYGWDPVKSLSAKPRNSGNRSNHPGRGGGRRGRKEHVHVGVAA